MLHSADLLSRNRNFSGQSLCSLGPTWIAYLDIEATEKGEGKFYRLKGDPGFGKAYSNRRTDLGNWRVLPITFGIAG